MGIMVEYSGTIRRPVAIVSRHFGDIHHHASNHIHRGVSFAVLSDDGTTCRYVQEVQLGSAASKDEIVMRREPDGTLRSDYVGGTNVGAHVVQTFTADGPDATAILYRMELPANGVPEAHAAAVAARVRAALAMLLEEDRIDLEERGYPR